MLFSEIIGQKVVRKRLLQMADEGRLPHAIMLSGQQGCGKMALALAFASYLLCDDKDKKSKGEPCGHCDQCRLLRKWHHPDLHFSYPTIKKPGMGSDHKPISDDFAEEWNNMLVKEGAYFSLAMWLSAIGAENQQAIITAGESDSLARKLSVKSSQGGYKVSIIWLPERMNAECANKLLKLIEEPPLRTVFMLVTEEPGKIIETIRSRTQQIEVGKTDDGSIAEALEERRGVSGEEARRIARIAGGNWLKAVEEITGGGEGEFLDEFKTLTRLAYQRDVRRLKTWSEGMQALGRERQKRFIEYFLHMARESFAYNFNEPALNYLTEQEEGFVSNFAPFINEANILEIKELADKSLRDISQNANAKIVFFDLALRMAAMIRMKV